MPDYRHCPRCASALQPYDERPYRRHCPSCDWRYWGNPRPTTGTLVEREGPDGLELLLIRRGIEPSKGLWGVPGGFIELDEEAHDAARRELLEETDIEIEAAELFGVWLDEPQDEYERTLNIVWRARVPYEEKAEAGDDADKVRWFTAETLPPLDEIAFASGKAAVARWLEEHERSR